MFLKTFYLYVEVIGAKLHDVEQNHCLMYKHVTTSIFSPPYYRPHPSWLVQIMPKRALSDRVKSLAQSKSKDSKIWEAVNMYQHKQEKPANCCAKWPFSINKGFAHCNGHIYI